MRFGLLVLAIWIILGIFLHLSQAPLPLNANEFEELEQIGIGTVFNVEISPDSRSIALGTAIGVYVYDLETLTQVAQYYNNTGYNTVAWSPTGAYLAMGANYEVSIRSFPSMEEVLTLPHPRSEEGNKISQFAWSFDGKWLAVGEQNYAGGIHLWEMDIKQETPKASYHHYLKAHENEFIEKMAWTTDGELVSSAWNGVLMWDTLQEIPINSYGASKFWLSANTNYMLAYNGWDGLNNLYDMSNTTHMIWFKPSTFEILAISPDGLKMLVADKEVYLWDTLAYEPIKMLFPDANQFIHQAVNWTPDGSRLVKVSSHEINVWDAETGESLNSLALIGGGNAPIWTEDQIISPLYDLLFSLDIDSNTTEILVHDNLAFYGIETSPISPDGRYKLNFNNPNHQDITLWDIQNRRAVYTQNWASLFGKFDWSPDGTWLVVTNNDFSFLAAVDQFSEFVPDEIPPSALQIQQGTVAWSSDSKHLVIQNKDALSVYQLQAEPTLALIEKWTVPILDRYQGQVAWSPNQKYLALNYFYEQVIEIWDAEQGTLLDSISLNDEIDLVTSITWSPDGFYVVTGVREGYFESPIYFWLFDSTHGKLYPDPIKRLSNHLHRDMGESGAAGITGLTWSPDGTQLASVAYDGVIRIWGNPDEE